MTWVDYKTQCKQLADEWEWFLTWVEERAELERKTRQEILDGVKMLGYTGLREEMIFQERDKQKGGK